MKNVRLFAVAAALGMFASTVAAAETTSKTTVKWTGADTIIKVDLGEELVVPTLTATVTTTTEGEKCLNGTDANGDGLVDGGFYAVDTAVNESQNWLYTNAKYWATNDTTKHTAIYYLGLSNGASVTGGRFLAPGSEEIEEDVYADQLGYKHYVGVEAAYNFLETQEYIKTNRDEDGNIANVVIAYTNHNYTGKGKELEYVEYVLVTAKAVRHADEYIMEAIVDAFTNKTALKADDTYYKTQNVKAYTTKEGDAPTVSVKVQDGTATSIAAGKIYVVTEGRKGYVDLTAAELTAAGLGSAVVDGAKKNIYSPYVLNGRATSGDLIAANTLAVNGSVFNKKAGNTLAEDETGFLITQKEVAAKDLAAGKTYFVTATTSDTTATSDVFTTDSVFYGVKASGDFTAYSTSYRVATTGELLDKIAYSVVNNGNGTTNNDGTYDKTVITDWKETPIYYGEIASGKVAKFTQITKDNYKTYFTFENISKLYLADYTSLSGSTGLKSASYDKVVSGVGYKAVDVTYPGALMFIGNSNVGAASEKKFLEATIGLNPAYNELTKLAKAGYVTIVNIGDADYKTGEYDGVNAKFSGADVVAQIKIDAFKAYELKNDYEIEVVDYEVETNRPLHVEAADVIAKNDFKANIGLIELTDVPANDTDYYVISNAGGLNLSFSYSSKKGTGTLLSADGKTEIPCLAVELGDRKNTKWYPAFETEEELVKAVYAITGLDKAVEGTKDKVSAFKTWYDAATADLEANTVDKRTASLKKELPESGNAVVHGAAKCEYTSTTEPKAVEVTADASAVKTDEAGIYDITYTAKVDEGAENATATVKVVVAPKYVRTWGANGKVATLTSFYVSNPEAKYAEYKYDWTAKKVTVTYYNIDGSVATTTVNNL